MIKEIKMKSNPTLITLFLIFLSSISVYSQSYYWYNNEQINIDIDRTKINVTIQRDVDLSALLREFAITEVKQIEETEDNTLLYSVRLPSVNQYNSIVSFLKASRGIVSVSPYFGSSPNHSRGTSSFFYVKLHRIEDYELLFEFFVI